jgi:xanthine dehydrogenase accessory factor
MKDVFHDIQTWIENDKEIALATVIETWGSSPRTVGAKMAVTQAGEITGSVSGGCVEGAVAETSVRLIKEEEAELLRFGVADETAWEVGLACGGRIEVFVRKLQADVFHLMQKALEEDLGFAIVTVIRGVKKILGREIAIMEGGVVKGSICDELNKEAIELGKSALKKTACLRVRLQEDVEVFVDVVTPPPTLIMVGGVHISVALGNIAKAMGYRTIVVDPRRQFGSHERFPYVDRLIQKWPDEAMEEVGIKSSTAVAMLTHDPKIDDPGLIKALPSQAFYVGALGSQKTQSARRKRLLAAGISIEQIDRLYGPIGLDLGGRTPEEIALAIMAEIVQARHK